MHLIQNKSYNFLQTTLYSLKCPILNSFQSWPLGSLKKSWNYIKRKVGSSFHLESLCAVGMCLSNGGGSREVIMIHSSVRTDWCVNNGCCRPHRVYHLMIVMIVFFLPVSCSFLADLIAFPLLLWRLSLLDNRI